MKELVFKWLFEKILPLSWIDGHKTEIARWTAFIFGVLTVIATFWPEYAPFITQAQASIATLLALLGIEIGKVHKEIKAARK